VRNDGSQGMMEIEGGYLNDSRISYVSSVLLILYMFCFVKMQLKIMF
jgi:hypothetical protein